MITAIVYLALVLAGLILGSFAGAQVWRLRAKQLAYEKKNSEPYDKAEYTKLKKLLHKSATKDRSVCLHCGYQLKWYDLLPLVSWLSLKGKCRSCHKRIGTLEPLIELGVASFFVASYVFWPTVLDDGWAISHFVLWLIAGVTMAVLFVYDLKWFLLPDRYSFALALVGLAIVVVRAVSTPEPATILIGAGFSVVALAGLYGALYVVSKGRWVGFGDVKLGIGLGLLLGDWQLALLAVFFANFIGCIVVIPLLAAKKIRRSAHIPFGPYLISGTILAWFIGMPVLLWYLTILGM